VAEQLEGPATRGGLQSFGKAQVINTIHLHPITQPVIRVARLDKDEMRDLLQEFKMLRLP
jgi:hypothetical protein